MNNWKQVGLVMIVASVGVFLGCSTNKVTQSQPSLSEGLRLRVITESAEGVSVGLMDMRTTPPQFYFPSVGEKNHGVEVIQADSKKGSVLIRRNGQDVWLTLK